MSQPQTLGKYQIQGLLGKGAMGVVYKGFDPNIARPVAIKTIHASLLDTEMGRELLDRFRNEAQAVGRLNHANIVSIYEFDQDKGTPYFVMEYVEGHDLKTLLKDGRKYSPEEAVHIVAAILSALEYTHKLGIVHRDIKPANVFITHNGQIKLADFGIARVDNAELTQMGSVLGTPSYMSPEQCKGQPVDARSDLFSTGVVLYELLVGKKPFSGDNTHAIMHSVLSEDPERPTSKSQAVPKAFDAIVRKALAKDLNHRYQTAAEFRDDLQKAVAPSSTQSNNLVMIAVVAALVLALAVAGGMWFKTQRDQQFAQPGVETTDGKLSAEEQAKLERLIKVAEAHFKVGRLVSPQGSNAFEAYQLVLQVDPQNSAALEGINRVKNRFFKRAQLLALEGRQEDVEKHLELAESLFPNDDRIMLLRNRVNEQ
ncbi:serine/threonine protein kinase [Ketobacter sp.]|uniref:serine/threonine protein kinase n=1 Tax=Ketobacter sp. TaxID=2083498 RepID=UPI000F130C61|nr:serine/threonine-protein kinase [Ketobacter sp.]RLU01089.1 MAG: serine/threonine protein kinase [Ketobacter sp.]